jgi:hypothetical protein
MTARNVLIEMVLEPGTGKALEVRAGQILRIEQIEGLQCRAGARQSLLFACRC